MTIRTLLEQSVARHPDRTAIRYRRDGVWLSRTYKDFAFGVSQMAECLVQLGLRPGDNRVAFILENSPEWMEAYLAVTGIGAQVVPLDPKLKKEEIQYVLHDSGTALVVTDAWHAQHTLPEILPALPNVRHVIATGPAGQDCAPVAGRPCHSYEGLRARVADAPLAFYAAHAAAPQDIASIIYTSGTTGRPKGAMLTHNNFCCDAEAALTRMDRIVTSADDFFIVLPLFHSFSFLTNFVLPILCTSGMLFVESLKTVADDMKALRPTIAMVVPLLVEKMIKKVEERINASPVTRLLMRVGLGKLVGKGVRKNLGGRMRLFIVGGAPCPVHVLTGFTRLGIRISEGYGLTECSPVVAVNPIFAPRIGTIGKVVADNYVRVAEPNEQGVGELQVRGAIVMRGYLNNPEATRETFDGDWLRTGDLASIDADGYITIRGRKKALIVNREGKNIYPEEVENVIARHPFIKDVIVLGYTERGQPGERVGGIVVPDLEAIAAEHQGQEPSWEAAEKFIRDAIAGQCRELADYKHLRKIRVQREPLERTSIQKVRRVAYQGSLDN
ncbi:MAG: AMP-binding protein [Kiritimatiellaeota bacterium]|nr:AMP-binding protein [Kiritimatiellota bacterium]